MHNSRRNAVTLVATGLAAAVLMKGCGGHLLSRPPAHLAPACTTAQLALSYHAGGAGAGNDFGLLQISDVSASACTLRGPLLVAGLDAARRARTVTVRFAVARAAVLRPATGQGDALAARLLLSAEYRDDPASAGGQCHRFWQVPASWQVILPGGQALAVANTDADTPFRLILSGGLVTCRGQLSAVEPASVGVL